MFDNPEAISRVMKVATTKLRNHVEQGHQIRPATVRDTRERGPVKVASGRQESSKVHPPIQRSRSR
ncbi:hypothetical protein FHS51_004143 [Sphingobium wenxiniae]|nr:hypothetical protein [Sphingobium wenxiniae]NYI24727.1 hypothetical protein [Sphingobium indicum]